MTTEKADVYANICDDVWKVAATALNSSGFVFPDEAGLPFKSIMRIKQRRWKIRLRKHGYEGKKAIYMDRSVLGCNGGIVYCQDKHGKNDAEKILEAHIRKANGLGEG
ncbi:hypothetical protein MTBLM1_20372 [Rhodospirillaceae bacterium LM-1]|nr:hypothetical protein MTBLM1_20372 [Rhodospirillaceae bacterium LM-1]